MNPAKFNPFVRIDPESSRITVTVPVPDTGQGVRTAVATMVAEELKVSVESLVLEQADGDADTYGSQLSANFNTMQRLHEPIRTAAATVRHLLVEAAAQRWQVAADQCRAADGIVWHGASRLSYHELAAAAATLTPGDVELTPQDEWRILGNPSVKRVDQREIVTGELAYAIDQPADLVAVIARPPWIGATPTRFDATKVRNAEVVQLDNGFALLAADLHGDQSAGESRDVLAGRFSGRGQRRVDRRAQSRFACRKYATGRVHREDLRHADARPRADGTADGDRGSHRRPRHVVGADPGA